MRAWLTLLLLLDSWLLLPVGCVNKIHNPNNIIHRCQLGHTSISTQMVDKGNAQGTYQSASGRVGLTIL